MTGGMTDPWTIGGDPAVDRILASVLRERRYDDRDVAPTPRQVAMVMHALADYTALQQALRWTAVAPKVYPADPAQSVGRWLHDLADAIERGAGL